MRRAVLTLALSSTLACGPGGEADAGEADTLGVADGGEDALSLDAPATPDAGAPCCVASHYASFPIPSTPGSGLPHEARYTVGLEQVVDEITGLTWQLHTDGVRRSLEEALAYCDALELGGRRDFVLPSRIELVTLLELERSPTVAPSLLPTEAEYHWTRSRYVARPASAFSVYFGAGAIEFGRGIKVIARNAIRPGLVAHRGERGVRRARPAAFAGGRNRRDPARQRGVSKM